MTNGLPRWFRLLFTGVMLALCIVMVTQIISHHSLAAEITTLEGKIDTAQKRLAKQEKELEEYSAELPLVLSELETAAPAAQEASDRVTELKAQRSALREEVARQADVIADLEAQLAALPEPDDTAGLVNDALTPLTEAQNALQN